ncbi:non-homologous end-joining DNA ligase [Aequorivita capsosiphonis]|uniref:non-homologous end-joining DNA ligase n=1 Tax=Aequorivita capsosiphonis TaxID=487317 RepID=UPI00042714BF|nr:non-homologous end-joining DNA ligase [Aequorivita capsosiphonis]
MKIAGIEISHADKLIFPSAKITKLQMVQYYESVAEEMLPFMKDRPLTLHRFPDGINADGFYHKKAADYFPDFIKTIKVKTEGGTNTQILCNSKKSLIYLANQGTVGFHIWLSKKDKLYKPDKVVFDLDPSTNDFEKVKEAAKITGDFLRKKNKDPQLMTSGKKGFHVYYSIKRTKTFDELRPLLKDLAEELESQNPDIFTTAIRKDKRNDKVFIDYLRNAYAQTSVCPYSLRPTKNAGVATPIEWDELKNTKRAAQYNLENILKENK